MELLVTEDPTHLTQCYINEIDDLKMFIEVKLLKIITELNILNLIQCDPINLQSDHSPKLCMSEVFESTDQF